MDVDYKALSNAGTWLIGRLQTDQDKQRLLDGLQSASGTFDRASAEKIISGLGKRVFLLHNVHAKATGGNYDALGDKFPGRTAHPYTDPGP